MTHSNKNNCPCYTSRDLYQPQAPAVHEKNVFHLFHFTQLVKITLTTFLFLREELTIVQQALRILDIRGFLVKL